MAKFKQQIRIIASPNKIQILFPKKKKSQLIAELAFSFMF